jgi:hypothetical protein
VPGLHPHEQLVRLSSPAGVIFRKSLGAGWKRASSGRSDRYPRVRPRNISRSRIT